MSAFMLTDRMRHRGWLLASLLVAAALVLSACDLVGDDTEDDEQAQQSQQGQQEMVEQQAEPTPAAPASAPAAQAPAEEPGPEPPPRASGGGEGATAYSILFPSLAFVMSGDRVATGLVISHGYIIVDEQALGGASAADAHLSNGDMVESLPVIGRDQLTGLAYLGPLDGNLVRRLPGARLGDGEEIPLGSSVYAVGFAASDVEGALPTVRSGVLSGVSEWEDGGRTLLRTDARSDVVTGGMVLVDNDGTVIGLATDQLVSSGLYVSSGDLARSLPPAELVNSQVPDPTTASNEHTVNIGAMQESVSLFLGDDATGQVVSLSVSSSSESALQVIDANGDTLQESTLVAGATIISIAPETAGPYELRISRQPAMVDAGAQDGSSDDRMSSMRNDVAYEVSSSAPLMSTVEADALAPLVLNTPFVGTIDVAGEEDGFLLSLRAGAEYEVTVQSLLIDSLVMVEGAGIDLVDDDSGGGPLGRDAALTLAPAEDGLVQVTVRDYLDVGTGAYLLTVTQVGGEPPEEAMAMEADDESDAMPAAMTLPAPSPPPAISLRGIGSAAGLQATLLGLGSESVGNGLLVNDADGAFEIVVSLIGVDGALGHVSVTDLGNEVVVEGRVLVTCPGSGSCLARADFLASEPGPGQWTVELSADEPGISEWQIEVQRRD